MSSKPPVLVVDAPAPSDPQALLERPYKFVGREQAESDPTLKQVIPYVVVTNGGRILAYKRATAMTEQRLVGQISVGWGGHIEEIDEPENGIDASLEHFIHACASREVMEELSLGAPISRVTLGLIDDDASEVGRFHVGWLEIWDYATLPARIADDTAEDAFWLTMEEAQDLGFELETWSKLALDRMESVQALS